MSCKILISTTVNWPSTARHAAGFAHAGCEVDVVAPTVAPVTLSRYVSNCYPYRPLSGLASLRAAITESQPDLIVSCDDRAVAILLQVFDAEPKDSPVAALIERSLGTPHRYARMISRDSSMRAARALGIRVPDTLPVSNEAALAECIGILGLPAVLKADGTWGGEGVCVVRTAEEARAAFRKLSRSPSRLKCVARAARRRDAHWLLAAVARQRRAISIQKFVEGQSAASGFAAWNGEVVGAVYYDVLKADGAFGPPSVIRRVDCPQIAEASRLVAQYFGLSGLHGMDFIRDSKGDVHLIEINPRATQGGTLPFGQGRDLASSLASCLAPGAKLRQPIENDTVVFFPREWLSNPASSWLVDGHHDVPWDDPAIMRAVLQEARPPSSRPAAPPLPEHRPALSLSPSAIART
jgi:hypothetical protein